MKRAAPVDDQSSAISTPSRPVRTCVGCRERAGKADLVRLVGVADGSTIVLVPDLRGSAAGRGAHLHPTVRCLDRAVQRKAFGRALRIAGQFDLSLVTAYVRAAERSTQGTSQAAVSRPEVEH